MRVWQALTYSNLEELDALAQAAEQFGYHGVTVGDHWVTAQEQLEHYLYSDDGSAPWSADTHWPDAWVQFAALAKVTRNLQFMSSVYVLPMRDVFPVAKAVSTAAYISGGRMHLGVGAGWQQFEFDLVQKPFAKRGRYLDEQLEVLAKLWSGEMVEHHGEFHDFRPLRMSPRPPAIPIYVGGDSPAALRRAARHDGWIGAGYQFAQIEPLLQQLRKEREKTGRGMEDFAVIVACHDLTPDRFGQLRDMGATDLIKFCWMENGKAMIAPTSYKIADLEQFANTYIRP
jgi:probable F420-dependent oxidoreductase